MDSIKNFDFLFWAYNIIWLGIAGFLLLMVLRMRGLDRRLDRVERELSRDAKE